MDNHTTASVASVVEGMTEAAYNGVDALRSSDLVTAIRHNSWKAVFASRSGATRSDALILGSLVHAIMAGGDALACYAVGAPINPTTGKPYGRDSDAYAKWLAQQDPSKTVVSAAEYREAQEQAKSLQDNPVVAEIMCGSKRELSCFGTIVGVPCKARLDTWNPSSGVLLDIKTTRDPLPEFPAAAARYRYAARLSFYAMVMEYAGLESPRSFVIAALSKDSGEVCAFDVPSDIVHEWDDEVLRWIGLYEPILHGGLVLPHVERATLIPPLWGRPATARPEEDIFA